MSLVFKIYGRSDDLVEIDGDISEELNPPFNNDEFNYLACYDGTLLSVHYDDEGIWRFKALARGYAYVSVEQNDPEDEDAYSDVVNFIDTDRKTKNTWFVLGEQMQVAR